MLYFPRMPSHHLLEAVTAIFWTCLFPAGKTPHCPVPAVVSAVAPHSVTLLLPASHQTPVCRLGNNLLWVGMEVTLSTSGEILLMTALLCHLLRVSLILHQYGDRTMEMRYAVS